MAGKDFDLERLLAPIQVNDFLRDTWEKQALAIRREDAEQYTRARAKFGFVDAGHDSRSHQSNRELNVTESTALARSRRLAIRVFRSRASGRVVAAARSCLTVLHHAHRP